MSQDFTPSVVTLDMIEQFATFEKISLEDGTQYPGVVGSLRAWEAGQGELKAELVNGNPVFVPLQEAYYKALGQEVPETAKVPLVSAGDEQTV